MAKKKSGEIEEEYIGISYQRVYNKAAAYHVYVVAYVSRMSL